MSTLKTYGTIAIMIACFAVVYPRFMHPLISRLLGFQQEQAKSNFENDLYPPGHRGAPTGQKAQGGKDHDDLRRHMRGGPHPGMRAAAEMHRQQAQQGSGRGMMGVVLPMYAVGIVLYLGYTLFKVFNRGEQKKSQWNNKRNYNNRGQQGHASDRDRMGFPVNYDGSDGGIKDFLQDEDQRRDLEELLTRVDDKNVSVEEMRVLQRRLEETEAQMTRILQAMQNVQSNVDNISPDSNPQGGEEEGETQSVSEQKGSGDGAKPKSSKSRSKHADEAEVQGSVKTLESDRAGGEPDRNAEDTLEDEEEEGDSGDTGSEEEETNDAFDVEEAEEEEEDIQPTDEIIPEKTKDDGGENKTTRQRNVKTDQ